MDTEEPDSRMPLWVGLLTTSIVSLCSMMAELPDRNDDDADEWQRAQKWAVSVASISIAFSTFGAVGAALGREKFNGSKAESMLISIVLVFWAAGLPSINNPSYELAVDRDRGIRNANLYFFSWGSLAVALMLSASYYQSSYSLKSKLTSSFFLLASASFVVFVNALDLLDDLKCKTRSDYPDFDDTTCNRTKFAMILGIVCAVLSLMIAPVSAVPIQGLVGILLLASWACGVSYITFGDGPGNELGNLYFATWICFILAMSIAATAGKLMLHDAAASGGDAEEPVKKNKKEEDDPSDDVEDEAVALEDA